MSLKRPRIEDPDESNFVHRIYDKEDRSEVDAVSGQIVRGVEKMLEGVLREMLDTKIGLSNTLLGQEKYNEAKEVLQQLVAQSEKTLGKNHETTLWGKITLGFVLHRLRKYDEAEKVYRHLIPMCEETLGHSHELTLQSKINLGSSLQNLGKQEDAERLFRQLVPVCEEILGQSHAMTLRSKHNLGIVLQGQGRYEDAEKLLRQVVHERKIKVRSSRADTLTSERLPQESLQTWPSSLPIINTTEQDPSSRLNSFFSEGLHRRQPYTDSEISEISKMLKQLNPPWSKVPRTYIILRNIGSLDLLNDLIDVGFSDYWFPVTQRVLPGCLRPSVQAAFVNAQSLVLTQSMDLERGEKGQHCHLKEGNSLPLKSQGILGSGGFGQVDKVVSQISFKEYARKRVPRRSAFKGRRTEAIQQFIDEIGILKRLKHYHIVEFVGSYTDANYIGLIMAPVAETNLADYLACASASNYEELRTFFGCLAKGLEFLHKQKIRHKDIKPSNILVHHGNVLYADFGLSLDFTDADGSTTISMVNGITPRYCAPEVALQEPRNTKSDIWSLGIVFLEMVVVLKGKLVQYIDDFFSQRGLQRALVRANITVFPEFIRELERMGNVSDNRSLGWIQEMLSLEQQSRPTASSLVASIVASGDEEEKTAFCGSCCFSSEEDFPEMDE